MKGAVSIVVNVVTVNVSSMHEHKIISSNSLFTLNNKIHKAEKEGYEAVSMTYNPHTHDFVVLMKKLKNE